MSPLSPEEIFELSPQAFAVWVTDTPAVEQLGMVKSLKTSAEEISEQGDEPRALAYLEIAGKIANFISDPYPYAIGLVWRGRANVFQRYSRFEESLQASENAAEIYSHLGNELDAARSRAIQVYVLGVVNRYVEACSLAARLLEQFAYEPLGRAFVSANLAQAHWYAGQLQAAYQEHQRAYQMYRDLEIPGKAARVLHNLGLCAESLDQLEEAEQYYREAAPQLIQTGEIFAGILALLNLAALYARQDRFPDAMQTLQEVRQKLSNIPTPAEQGYVDLAEAHVWSELGQKERAVELLRQAARQFDRAGFYHDQAETLAELGWLLAKTGQSTRIRIGLEHLQQAAQLAQRIADDRLKALIAIKHAELLTALGQGSQAVPLLETAQHDLAALGLVLSQGWAAIALADCLSESDPVRAGNLYRTGLEWIGSDLPLLVVRAESGLARLAAGNENIPGAQALYQSAITWLTHLRRRLRSHNLQAGFLNGRERLFEELIDLLHTAPGCEESVYTWVERSKSAALAELTSSLKPQTLPDPAMAALLAERNRLQGEYDRRTNDIFRAPSTEAQPFRQQRGMSGVLEERTRQELASLRQRLQRLEERIAFFPTPTDDWLNQDTLPVPAAHNLIAHESLYLSYYCIGDQLYALSATSQPGDIQIHPLGCSLTEVQEALLFIANLMIPQGRLRRLQERLQDLYRMLVAPLAERLLGCQRLVISPVQQLFQVPFAALWSSEDGYLGQRFALQLVPNAALLDICRQRTVSSGSPLMVGYPGEPGQATYLTHIENEITNLHQLYPQASVLLGESVQFETLLKEWKSRSIIHLAGHIHYNSEHPLDSGIPLAGGRWLHASDLYLLHGSLAGSLIVLSGCESGQTGLAGSEILGLNSAFLYAGASSILSSLWPVDDAATQQLMTAFYHALSINHNPALSLKSAQASLLQSSTLAHPYYWAAFQWMGA
jgi:CHAT domain-containing protein/tetratricopeptide (TPR) repeat protein